MTGEVGSALLSAKRRTGDGVTSNLRWLGSMSVGVTEFDDDHKRVIVMLREITDAIGRGDRHLAHETSLTLLKLAGDHVEREEAFLSRIRFPGTRTVITAQKASLANIVALADKILADPDHATEAAAAMGRAFIEYLLRADINFKSYVDAAGLRDVAD